MGGKQSSARRAYFLTVVVRKRGCIERQHSLISADKVDNWRKRYYIILRCTGCTADTLGKADIPAIRYMRKREGIRQLIVVCPASEMTIWASSRTVCHQTAPVRTILAVFLCSEIISRCISLVAEKLPPPRRFKCGAAL